MCWPPLMLSVDPVMKPPSSEQRKATPRALSRARGRERWTGPATAASIHVLAAVDAERRSGDEAAVVGAEEGHSASDLVGAAEAADRNPGDDLLEHFGGHRGHHLGVDIAG